MVTMICIILVVLGVLLLSGVAFLAIIGGIASWLIDPLLCVLGTLMLIKAIKMIADNLKKGKESED